MQYPIITGFLSKSRVGNACIVFLVKWRQSSSRCRSSLLSLVLPDIEDDDDKVRCLLARPSDEQSSLRRDEDIERKRRRGSGHTVERSFPIYE